ncbi:MAG TPA: ParA family protein [Chitinophagales bacterium]|nr:ParA family protein [Chitinophagales bacterium]
MTKVISFINRKGGSGKTTSAINTATALRQMGFEVTLMETDTNYSLSHVRNRELAATGEGGGRYPDLMQTEEDTAAKVIKSFRRNMVDFVIVDGAANMGTDAIRSVCANSDVVVIPTSLSEVERMVSESTLNDILPVMRQKRDLKVVLLANRVHFLTSHETVCEAFANFPVPLLDVHIPNYKLFTYLNTMSPAECYRQVTNCILQLFADNDLPAQETGGIENSVGQASII